MFSSITINNIIEFEARHDCNILGFTIPGYFHVNFNFLTHIKLISCSNNVSPFFPTRCALAMRTLLF